MRKILSIKKPYYKSNKNSTKSTISTLKKVENSLNSNVFKKNVPIKPTNINALTQTNVPKISMKSIKSSLSNAREIYANNKSFMESIKPVRSFNTLNNRRSNTRPSYVGGRLIKKAIDNKGHFQRNESNNNTSFNNRYLNKKNDNNTLNNSNNTHSTSSFSAGSSNASSSNSNNSHNNRRFDKKTVNTKKKEFDKKNSGFHRKHSIKKTTFHVRKKIKKRQKAKVVLNIKWDKPLNYIELASLLSMDNKVVLAGLQDIENTIDKNSLLPHDIVELYVDSLGHKPEHKISEENIDFYYIKDTNCDLKVKKPVISFAGHIDHGKTSLIQKCIDIKYIKKEYGGITQNIAGYNHEKFTIIDTPGHSILSGIRQYVMEMVDVIVLIISGTEGIKDQTQECLDFILAHKKNMIVVINKIDLCNEDDIQNIKNDLVDMDIDILDEIPCIETSAIKDNKFVEKLDTALNKFRTNIFENQTKYTTGYILDSQLDIKQGIKTTVLVTSGQLKQQDIIATNTSYGKIKGMVDHSNVKMKIAKAGDIVTILGFKDVVTTGQKVAVVNNHKLASDIAKEYVKPNIDDSTSSVNTLEDLFSINDKKQVYIILKGFNNAVLSDLKQNINKIESKTHNINIVSHSVGQANELDIHRLNEEGIIYCHGLQQKKDNKEVLKLAKSKNIEIKHFDVIFGILNDIESMIKSEEADKELENKVIGKAKILKLFTLSNKTVVAGCRVISGLVHKRHRISVYREEKEIYSGNSILSIKRLKDDLVEVASGEECGIQIKDFNEYKEGDIIQVYEQKK